MTAATFIAVTFLVIWPYRIEAALRKLELSPASQPVRDSPQSVTTRHSKTGSESPASWRVAAHPKFFVQEPPARFKQGANGVSSTADQAFGYRALDETVSEAHELWGSRWYNQDLWFSDQWRISPLRSHSAAEADAVLVPASLAIRDIDAQDAFIETAPTFLPLLGSKPHLLVLNHAATTYLTAKSKLLTHPNAQHFTFISLNPWAAGHNTSHLISCPYFFHVHWSRGTLSSHTSFDAESIKERKTMFAVESFQARLPEREVVYRSCSERPDACKHLHYDKEGAVGVWEAMQSAWYVLHPRGDFLNRAAWYDSVLADSIPVVFNSEYNKTLPFAHLVDYSRVMVTLPIERLMATDAPNAIDLLTNGFNAEEAMDKLRYISSIKQVFQYMVNPAHELIRFDRLRLIEPEDDAFTATMKAALTNMCQRHLLPVERCQTVSAAI